MQVTLLQYLDRRGSVPGAVLAAGRTCFCVTEISPGAILRFQAAEDLHLVSRPGAVHREFERLNRVAGVPVHLHVGGTVAYLNIVFHREAGDRLIIGAEGDDEVEHPIGEVSQAEARVGRRADPDIP